MNAQVDLFDEMGSFCRSEMPNLVSGLSEEHSVQYGDLILQATCTMESD